MAILLATPTLADPLSDFTRSKTKTIAVDEIEEFYLTAPQNLTGHVRFISEPGNKAKVLIEYHGKAEDESEFKWFLDLLDIDIDKDDEIVKIEISTPDHAPWEGIDKSITVSIQIKVHEKMALIINGRFHSIDIDGPFRQLEIDNDYGDIKVKKIEGDVDIRTSHQNVELTDIHGRVNIQSNSGSITATNIDCEASQCRFETTNGRITLNDIKGEIEAITSHKPIILNDIDAGEGLIHVLNSYGMIEMSRIAGVLDIKTDYSPIKGQMIDLSPGTSKISGSYDSIVIHNISLDDCDLRIDNSFSDVSLSIDGKVSTQLMLTTDKGGAIYTKGLPINPTAISRNRFEGVVRDGESSIEINIQGIGKINIIGNNWSSPIAY